MTLWWQMTGDRGEGPTMRYWRRLSFAWILGQKTEGINIRKSCSYNWRSVPDVRDSNLSSYFLVFSNIFAVILYINDVIRGGGGIYQEMTWWLGGGCLKWPKKGWLYSCTAPNIILSTGCLKKKVRMFVCLLSPKPINKYLSRFFLLKTEIHK